MRLCLDVTRWITKLIGYINRELKEVENYGIPESKVYTLMSNQLITILNSMWSVRTMMQEFVSDSDLELYAARAVMITMRVHMVQEDFANLEFKSHNLIAVACSFDFWRRRRVPISLLACLSSLLRLLRNSTLSRLPSLESTAE
jgi:hypothetical protein